MTTDGLIRNLAFLFVSLCFSFVSLFGVITVMTPMNVVVCMLCAVVATHGALDGDRISGKAQIFAYLLGAGVLAMLPLLALLFRELVTPRPVFTGAAPGAFIAGWGLAIVTIALPREK